MTYQQHPLSAAFPAMSDEDYQALKDSIESVGVLNPITLFEGQVIDGWHRYQAASELMMPCPSVELDQATDPRDFVVAQNKARRHLLKAQLIAIGTKVYASWRPRGGNQSALSADCISSEQVAEKLGASVRSVEQFREVERKAVPEVVKAVERGEIGLPKATEIAKLPKQEQAKAIDQPLPKKEKKVIPTDAPKVEVEGYSEVQRLKDEAQELRDVVARLHDELAVAKAAGGDESLFKQTLDEANAQIRVLIAQRDALKSQLDLYIAENGQMKKQMAWQRKQIDKQAA